MKYVMAEGRSIISNGVVYAPGMEIEEKAFVNKADFEAFVAKGFIVKAEAETKAEKAEEAKAEKKESKGK
jgi:hypothetical protein